MLYCVCTYYTEGCGGCECMNGGGGCCWNLGVVGIAAGILEERVDAADLQDPVDLGCQ